MSKRIDSPESWRNPDQHLQVVLSSPWYKQLSDLLSQVSYGTHSFFQSQGARAAFFPVTTGAVSSPIGRGSDSVPVKIVLGNREQFLADSMQFFLEVAVRIHRCPVYYIMPSFRGEPVDARHLNQFFHVEAEVPGGIVTVMSMVESYIRSLASHLLDKCADSICQLAGTTAHVSALLDRESEFPRIRFEDAVRSLEPYSGSVMRRDGVVNITAAGERELIRQFGEFIWITHFPRLVTPFYQARDGGSCNSLNADLLAGMGEIVGAGERAFTANDLRESLHEHEVSHEDYSWYIQMKETTVLQTSGFGMGIERFLLWLTATEDIRNLTILLRDNEHEYIP